MVRVRWSNCVGLGLLLLGLGVLAKGPSPELPSKAPIYGSDGAAAWTDLTSRLVEFTNEFDHVILHRVEFSADSIHLSFTFNGAVGLRGAATLRRALTEYGFASEVRSAEVRLLHHRNCCGRHGEVNEVLLLQVCLKPSATLRAPPAPGALTLVAPCELVGTHPEMTAHACNGTITVGPRR